MTDYNVNDLNTFEKLYGPETLPIQSDLSNLLHVMNQTPASGIYNPNAHFQQKKLHPDYIPKLSQSLSPVILSPTNNTFKTVPPQPIAIQMTALPQPIS